MKTHFLALLIAGSLISWNAIAQKDAQYRIDSVKTGLLVKSEGTRSTPIAPNLVGGPAFKTLVTRDFATISGGPTNVALVDQLVVSLKEDGSKLELNIFDFCKNKPEKRPLVRLGAHLAAGLTDGFASLFTGKGVGSTLELGPRLTFDWYSRALTPYSRYFFNPKESKTQQFIHRHNRLRLQRRNSKQSLIEKIDAQQKKLGTMTEDDRILNLPTLDSLQQVLEDFDTTTHAKEVELALTAPFTHKKYLFTTVQADYVNTNVKVYDESVTNLDDRFSSVDIPGYKLGLALNYAKISANETGFLKTHFLSVSYDVTESAPLLNGDPAEQIKTVIYGLPPTGQTGSTYAYTTKQSDVYVGETGQTTVQTLTFNALGFFKARDRWGATLQLKKILRHAIPSELNNETSREGMLDGEVGLIVPAVTDDDDFKRLNIILTLGFKNIAGIGDVTKSPTLWSRKTIGIRVGLPFKLPSLGK